MRAADLPSPAAARYLAAGPAPAPLALPYSVREGLVGFRRAGLATATSVVALALALALIGLFGLLGWQWQQVSTVLRERASEAEVFLKPIDDAAAARVGERLAELPGLDSLQFISHAEAARIFRESFGEGADLYADEQFLPASYRIRLGGDYASPDSLSALAAYVRGWTPVDDVVYDEVSVLAVERNRRAFTLVAATVALLVVLAALLLVGNTVRLSIYARRMLIRTMKLVGATNGFIRRPFLVEGLIQGLVAGVAAGLALWGLYSVLLSWLGEADVSQAALAWPGGTPLVAIAAIVALGLVLGWLASWLSVRHFIRRMPVS